MMNYTASERDEKVKSRIFIGGTIIFPLRCGFPKASTLFSIMIGLSLNLKFFTGNMIFPFSI